MQLRNLKEQKDCRVDAKATTKKGEKEQTKGLGEGGEGERVGSSRSQLASWRAS